MKAFRQMIWCPCAIIRVGPEAKKYWDPWEYAVVVKFPWHSILRWLCGMKASAPIHALQADGKFSMVYAKPVLDQVKALGFHPVWKRAKRHGQVEAA